MPAVTKVPLGASTFVHKWCVDLNDVGNGGTFAAPAWVGLFGTNDFVFAIEPSTEDDGDFDSPGWGSETTTSRKWKADTTLLRKTKVLDPFSYDDGQEIARAAGFELGDLNRVDARIYEMTAGGPKVEAYRGYASVQWVPAGGDNKAIEKVKLTLSGSGTLSKITHPDGAAVVPVLRSVSPAVGVQAGGTLHHLFGVGFFAAGVSSVASMVLGVTNVPTYVVENDSELVFLAPAKAAGQFIVKVTNAVGQSITTSVILDIT